MSYCKDSTTLLCGELSENPSHLCDKTSQKKVPKSRSGGRAPRINGRQNPSCVKVKRQNISLQYPVVHDCARLTKLLKACAKEKDLNSIRRIHASILRTDLVIKDIYVGTSILHIYAKCGVIREANAIFYQLHERNVVSWNALITAYTENGLVEQALKCFEQMIDEGVCPDNVTFICSVKACTILGSLDIGQKLHARIRQNETLTENVMLANALISMYSKCGAIENACEVFDQLSERDVVSWTALIACYVENGLGEQALKCFGHMEDEGFSANEVTYIFALKACIILRSLEIGEKLYANIREKGLLRKNIMLGNTLIDMYAKCCAIEKACEVFDQLPHRDIVSWTTLIAGYVQNGLGFEALKLFRLMDDEGVCPNEVTYIWFLKACAIVGSLQTGEEIHGRMSKQGFPGENIMLRSTLIYMYAKCGAVKKAREVFDDLEQQSVVSWNTLIAGYVENGLGDQALNCFWEMKDGTVSPNAVTYTCCLKACVIVGSVETGEDLCAEVIEQGLLQKDIILGNTLIDMYAKCGEIEKAHEIFDWLPQRDVVSWNVLISGYVDSGDSDTALKCFAEMKDEGITPDTVTYICSLKACAVLGAFEIGKAIHAELRDNGFLRKDIALGNTLITMYVKCGFLDNALTGFDELPVHDVVSWNALMAGYAQVGLVDITLDLFKRMRAESIVPNHVTFLVLLIACSHGSLFREGKNIFDVMIAVYGFTPTAEHYSCMVDLFGRAGQLDKAKLFLRGGVSPLLSFLGACKKWQNVDLGRWAFDKIILLDKTCAAAYVSMSNIYAAMGMQFEAHEIEGFRIRQKAWKVPRNSAFTGKIK